MSKTFAFALFAACAFAFVAAPVGFDPTTGQITVKQALAKHGADDVVPETQAEPEPNDVPPHK